MVRESEDSRIIRPPGERISHGRVFRPSQAYFRKSILELWLGALFMWLIVLGIWFGISLIGIVDVDFLWMNFAVWWQPITIWMWVFNLIWLIPGMIVVQVYVRSIEYSVISESGESMPEVYVQKGIFYRTRKHVPFRTITNISTKSGPLDRLFGIGSVNIETAGFSGEKKEPEEKLEGIEFYEEVRDFILQELRKFQAPYTTGTEHAVFGDAEIPKLADSLDDEILMTLRDMKTILEDISKKLGKR
ncbi:MAG: PH domain-containing protein [Candidatus Hermodarchaeia archaeon]